MVDVSAKEVTERFARATGVISMSPEALEAVRKNAVAKGDVLAVARIAGVMAAKRTAELIPLCHPLTLTDVQVIATIDDTIPGVRVESAVRSAGKTGVEMEAIVAVSVTLVTVYDMCKSLDKSMVISDICLAEKAGGRSGTWKRP
jgi:cyclic pyranopterin phosphate synthase